MPEAGYGMPDPDFASSPPQVLARMPDLDEAEPTSFAVRGGRILGSRLSLLILAGGALLLLLAAVALPWLFNGSDTSETAFNEELPTAPLWEGPSSDGSNWQAGGESPGYYQSDSLGASSWDGNARTPEATLSAQGQASADPWESQRWSDQPEGQSWGGQPDANSWAGQVDAPLVNGQPSWPPVSDQTYPSTQDSQLDFAGGPSSSPTGGAGWPALAPEAAQPPNSHWSDQAEPPPWQIPPYRLAERAQPEAAWPADASRPSFASPAETRQFSQAMTPDPASGLAIPNPPSQYAGRFDAGYPSANPPYRVRDSYPALPEPVDAYRWPQVAADRSTTINDYRQAGISDYPTDDRYREQPTYRTADARAGTYLDSQIRDPWDANRGTLPTTRYPQAGSLRTGAPLSRYPAADYPTDRYRRNRYPSANDPGPNDRSSYPSSNDPAAANRVSGYLPTGPSTGASRSAPSYGAGVYSRQPEPGVARFQGGIQKPIGNDVDDLNRSGLY